MRHRPCCLIGAGTPVPLFLSPKEGWSAGRRQGLARPLGGRTLAIGFAQRAVRERGDESRPGRATPLRSGVLRLPALHSVEPEGSPRCTGCLPARRSAAGPCPPRDGKGQEADAGYIFLDRRIVKRDGAGAAAQARSALDPSRTGAAAHLHRLKRSFIPARARPCGSVADARTRSGSAHCRKCARIPPRGGILCRGMSGAFRPQQTPARFSAWSTSRAYRGARGQRRRAATCLAQEPH